MVSKEEIRRKIAEQREKEWIRDAVLLRNKKPEESLKACFHLIEFSQKLNRWDKK